jgi:hypothetical protein
MNSSNLNGQKLKIGPKAFRQGVTDYGVIEHLPDLGH